MSFGESGSLIEFCVFTACLQQLGNNGPVSSQHHSHIFGPETGFIHGLLECNSAANSGDGFWVYIHISLCEDFNGTLSTRLFDGVHQKNRCYADLQMNKMPYIQSCHTSIEGQSIATNQTYKQVSTYTKFYTNVATPGTETIFRHSMSQIPDIKKSWLNLCHPKKFDGLLRVAKIPRDENRFVFAVATATLTAFGSVSPGNMNVLIYRHGALEVNLHPLKNQNLYSISIKIAARLLSHWWQATYSHVSAFDWYKS